MSKVYKVTWYRGRPTRGAKLVPLFSAILEFDYEQEWLGLKKADGRDVAMWVTKGYHRVARKIT